jgi:hypothetical protein
VSFGVIRLRAAGYLFYDFYDGSRHHTEHPFGLGPGPAAALLITLPALSLPSALMVGCALGWRTVAALGLAVAVVGVIGGCIGWVWLS